MSRAIIGQCPIMALEYVYFSFVKPLNVEKRIKGITNWVSSSFRDTASKWQGILQLPPFKNNITL